jgi:hypothetical protein
MILILRLRGSCLVESRFNQRETAHARGRTPRLAAPHAASYRGAQGTSSHRVGTLTGVARELILTGLAGGDNKALGERLTQIERRLATLEGLARDVSETARHIDSVTVELRDKFDALLNALSSAEGAV